MDTPEENRGFYFSPVRGRNRSLVCPLKLAERLEAQSSHALAQSLLHTYNKPCISVISYYTREHGSQFSSVLMYTVDTSSVFLILHFTHPRERGAVQPPLIDLPSATYPCVLAKGSRWDLHQLSAGVKSAYRMRMPLQEFWLAYGSFEQSSHQRQESHLFF